MLTAIAISYCENFIIGTLDIPRPFDLVFHSGNEQFCQFSFAPLHVMFKTAFYHSKFKKVLTPLAYQNKNWMNAASSKSCYSKARQQEMNEKLVRFFEKLRNVRLLRNRNSLSKFNIRQPKFLRGQIFS